MSLAVPLLRESFKLVLQRDQVFPRRMYEILFKRHPEAKALFMRNSEGTQHTLVAQTLTGVLDHLEDPEWLTAKLGRLGAEHETYGVTPEMYAWVGDALITALAEITASDWTPDLQSAWTEAYAAIVSIMCPAALTSLKRD